ncbi:MAG TPA: hypothetical protein VEQ18_04480, partial [Candidatus Nitrosocosmicus sp.]|nr:hypothetical protein [Candidatus Nitrosocosmicus sp.]
DDLLKNELPFENESEELKKILSPIIKRLSTEDQIALEEAESGGLIYESIDLIFSAFKLGLLKFSVEEVQEPVENVEMLPKEWY